MEDQKIKNIRRKKGSGYVFVSLLILFFMNFGITHAQSSTVKKSVLDQAGNISQSSGYRVNDAAGQPSPIGTCYSTNYIESSGFFGGGVIPTGVEKEDANKIPASFNLFQNYPNPFNPSTTIHYSIEEFGQVKLQIYNSLGKAVRTLVNREQPAGEYTIFWDGRDEKGMLVSDGIYFYRLQAGKNRSITKRMVLIK